MYVCMYVCVYVCMYVCTYVCMCVCTNASVGMGRRSSGVTHREPCSPPPFATQPRRHHIRSQRHARGRSSTERSSKEGGQRGDAERQREREVSSCYVQRRGRRVCSAPPLTSWRSELSSILRCDAMRPKVSSRHSAFGIRSHISPTTMNRPLTLDRTSTSVGPCSSPSPPLSLSRGWEANQMCPLTSSVCRLCASAVPAGCAVSKSITCFLMGTLGFMFAVSDRHTHAHTHTHRHTHAHTYA